MRCIMRCKIGSHASPKTAKDRNSTRIGEDNAVERRAIVASVGQINNQKRPPAGSDAVRTMTVHLAIVSVSTPFSLVPRCQATEAPRTHGTR